MSQSSTRSLFASQSSTGSPEALLRLCWSRPALHRLLSLSWSQPAPLLPIALLCLLLQNTSWPVGPSFSPRKLLGVAGHIPVAIVGEPGNMDKAMKAHSPWPPKWLASPWPPETPDPPWRPSLSSPCSCLALASKMPAPPSPVELLQHETRLMGGGSNVTFRVFCDLFSTCCFIVFSYVDTFVFGNLFEHFSSSSSELDCDSLWAGYGVMASFSYEWNTRWRSEVHRFSGEQQPFTGSDFGDTPAWELALW